ncbi:MAG TPA: GrpB family protein [Candidatus Sulfotelmatobacter sp.]
MTEPIIIQDYDSLWPERFEILRSRISAGLDGLATAIEHIGSTAVPGLAGKPVIDIDVLLKSDANLSLAISRLSDLGYEHRGNLGIAGREAFQAPLDDFPHHLYVCSPGSQTYERHIAFRDHLRTHPSDADAYARLKRKLATKFDADREAFTQGKSEFVEEILRRATSASERR